MRLALILPLLLSSVTLSWAQTPAPEAAPKAAIEKRTERLRIEDSGSRIDELRVGGETKTITVQPKGGMPAYDVQPQSGERTWKIVGF